MFDIGYEQRGCETLDAARRNGYLAAAERVNSVSRGKLMPGTQFEAGKRWGEQTIHEIERDLGISLDLQWGPPWIDLRRKRQASTPSAQQLILACGRIRKIVWLDALDLRSVASEAVEKADARQRIRSRISDAIVAIAQQSSAA